MLLKDNGNFATLTDAGDKNLALAGFCQFNFTGKLCSSTAGNQINEFCSLIARPLRVDKT